MKIGKRGGHSKNCLGSVGLRNEYEQMQILDKYVTDILTKYGHTVIDCNSNAGYMVELREGVTKANNANVDFFISLHMNASTNHEGYGTEAWVYANRGLSGEIATRLVNNYENLGFKNRGVKEDKTRLYELRAAKAPAIIFETCFCDNRGDINIWSPLDWETIARNICNAIDPNIPLLEETEPPRQEAPVQEVKKDKWATTKNVTSVLNMREEPTVNSKIIKQIPTGAGFWIKWTVPNWHYVRYYDIEGFVSADYVEILED